MSQVHEPWASKEITIEELLDENLKLRQEINRLKKFYNRIIWKAVKQIRRVSETNAEYMASILENAMLTQKMKEMEAGMDD